MQDFECLSWEKLVGLQKWRESTVTTELLLTTAPSVDGVYQHLKRFTNEKESNFLKAQKLVESQRVTTGETRMM